jgi:predicted nucleic acid-binding protein
VIFVDTSFWVALQNLRDDRHGAATSLLELHGDRQLMTTNHVRGETWTFLRRRAGHPEAVAFLDAVGRSPRILLVAVGEEQEDAALRWLRRHDERAYSFVDATSFAVMRERRVALALAFDGYFSAAGFQELRP